jgi:hypothetical protein
MLWLSLYVSCPLSSVDAESNVFITLTHVHTLLKTKKKLHLLYEDRRRN